MNPVCEFAGCSIWSVLGLRLVNYYKIAHSHCPLSSVQISQHWLPIANSIGHSFITMVNNHTYILPTSSESYLNSLFVFYSHHLNQTLEFHVQCRLYSALWSRPRQVTMLT
jgi:hypothetical protein